MASATFNSVSDITFSIVNNEVKVFVKGTLLGTIGQSSAVTLYTVISGSTRTLVMQNISQSAYRNGNTDDPNTDTIQLHLNTTNLGFNVQCCPSNSTAYKLIGWETDTVGQVCAGGKGSNAYYDISTAGAFKAMIEPVGGNNELMLIVRYNTAVNSPYSGSNPVCAALPYCYICLS